ncbi:hypothetical protein QBC34DRAFT_384994 [Podospora aff. communis PSN243]|uniref:Nucleoside phosphorylase domain-containing protein n=1 Tax=Podospora aff. communis PSN243 TaxID=3040156 RepID=A0AAV9G9I1_9PEZI|nr:hypothetical protein QBC34DRAFT_384994 [Podospora aff. communis PSN243]
MASSNKLTHDDYTVGWVSALPVELTAAMKMLDETHPKLPIPKDDTNRGYEFGSIAGHNVVLTCLPAGGIGTTPATAAAIQMVRTFRSIRFGLMVGVGASVGRDVRLGDVVVSTPEDNNPGVIQWDFGKAEDGGNFRKTGSLDKPPGFLLTALNFLRAKHNSGDSRIEEYLDEMLGKFKSREFAVKYLKPSSEDVLFRAKSAHVIKRPTDSDGGTDREEDEESSDESCQFCDKTKVVKRKCREPGSGAKVHYGLIASGNRVIKDAVFRDELKGFLKPVGKVLSIEMEAAGLMDNFPCLVIRGICDYADSHKNKTWQPYAAAVAAAFAKDLLQYVQPKVVEAEERIISKLEQIVKQVESDTATARLRSEEQKDLQILEWITPFNYGHQQSHHLKKHQPGTGEWFLSSIEFKTWIEAGGQTLFCHGNPGSGKTIMTSIAIDEVKSHFGNNASVGIAYIYCDYLEINQQQADDLLSSVLKQLAQRSMKFASSLPENVKSLYDRHQHEGTRPGLEEISTSLESVASAYHRIFILIDGLDEADKGCRTKFLRKILPIPDIISIFEKSGSTEMEIRADDEDVQRYIEGHIEEYLPTFVHHDQELRQLIKTKISEAASGVFLIAYLSLRALGDKHSRKDLKTELNDLHDRGPSCNRSRAYDKTMDLINRQQEGWRKLARRVLGWVTYAERPMTALELQHALAVESNTSEMDAENLTSVEDMISVTAGLVMMEKETNIIRLVHFSTREYLRNREELSAEAFDSEIAKMCGIYLGFATFASGACNSHDEFLERMESNPFYRYASHNWGHHARRTPHLCHEAMAFLDCQPKVEASVQALFVDTDWRRWPSSYDYYKYFPHQSGGLHLAARLGVEQALAMLLQHCEDPNPQDSYGNTPLSLAADGGHEAAVKLLLATDGVEIDVRNVRRRTPLHEAAQRGHKVIVKLLLDTERAEPQRRHNYGQMSLNRAAEEGRTAVGRLLLASCRPVKADLKDELGRTPLSYAAEEGHKDVVELLLDNCQVYADSYNKVGRTVLSDAAGKGHRDIVQLLLSNSHVHADSVDKWGRTPLSYAAKKGDEGIVNLLLATGQVNLNAKDKNGVTPLGYATIWAHQDVAKLLLATGQVDVNSKDKYGYTPLIYATVWGHQDVVELLRAYPGIEDLEEECNGAGNQEGSE